MDFIQEPLNKFLNYLKVKIKSLEARFYLFGISVIVFSTILMLNRQNNIITLVILSAGIMLFCLGFMFWCYSLLKMRWILGLQRNFHPKTRQIVCRRVKISSSAKYTHETNLNLNFVSFAGFHFYHLPRQALLI